MDERRPESSMVGNANLVKKRGEYRKALGEALERIVSSLKASPEVERVILFGSYARGKADLRTDLDLIVVMTSPRPFLERTAELYGRLQTGIDLDLLVYTPEEWEKQRETPFIRRALLTGKVLYEKRSD
jgi:predicted nucleotidyltransferase